MPFRLLYYIFREALPYILLTLLILTSLILAQQVTRQSELLFGSTASLMLSLQLIYSLLPGILVITLPFSLLIGSLMGLNRLLSDSEIIAAQASGISFSCLSLPLVACGIVGAMTSSFLTLHVIPQLYAEAKHLRNQLLLQAIISPIKPRTFNTHFPNHLLYIRDIDKSTGDWLGAFIIRKEKEKESVVLTAERGRLRMTQTSPVTLEIDLINGQLITLDRTFPEKQTTVSFQQQEIKLSSEKNTLLQALDKERATQELTLSQLRDRSAQANSERDRRQAQVEWHKRLALPPACIILVLLALPLSASAPRQAGRAVAFALGFGLAVLYYLILLAGQNFALSGVAPVWLGVWSPNLIGLAASFYLGLAPGSHSRLRWVTKPTLSFKQFIKDRQQPLIPKTSSRFFKVAAPLLLTLIDSLLISELAKYFFLSCLTLVFTSLTFTLFDLLPSLSRSGLGWRYAAVYLFYLAPQIFYYIAPFAVLLAILIAHGVLARSNQITALLTSGLSLLRLGFPFLCSVLAIIFCLFWLSEAILPLTNQEQDARYNQIKGKTLERAVLALGQRWTQGEEGTIYGYQYDSQTNKLLNTTVYRIDAPQGKLKEIIQADDTAPLNATTWRVLSGWRIALAQVQVGFFLLGNNPADQLVVSEGQAIFNRVVNESAKMSFFELRQYIHYLARLGVSTTSLRVDLEKKLAFPFSCLPLLAIAFPLATRNNRRGSLAGIGLSIGIGFTFWISASLFEGLGRQGYLPPGLAAWGPLALFFALGVFLAFRLRK
jgi:LPS export ABC transporter permease LptF/LPS export ABC transporter permease LptG